ncbi:hypothetical protein [Saccharopolyspora phatthalungensis]|uniref:Uncharacterized protein n=1 Tax=Saccharopolyspora phatthalungensis TaxID=664693 RepID=A0A840QEN1_9PSEU|nr:hypothetical protein [Saccharopolyspora phatthalungensis]MBB5159274.1 hypothetical protein [Saccharopolyspora phatthalungensis]
MTDTGPQFIGKPMSPPANLAVALRQAQWDLERVAFAMPRGEISKEEILKLADSITELADRLRMHPPS